MKRPTKTRVLYLEDDLDSRDMVTYMLKLSNIEVITADTIAKAWYLTKKEPFDLYLLDGLLPTGSSLKLCRDIRSYSPDTPILFYSGLAFQSDIKLGLEAGATGYLVKPYFGDLSETIINTIRDSIIPNYLLKPPASHTLARQGHYI